MPNNNRNGLRPRGRSYDQGEEDDENNGGAALPDPDQCAGLVRMMLAKHAANDQQNGGETAGHQRLMEHLAEIIKAEHQGNGGNGYRNGRDQTMSTMPSSAPPPPARYDRRPRRTDDRRPAQDSGAEIVAELNHRAWARRWPGAATVRTTGSWRA